MVDHLINNGFNVVAVNHFSVDGVTNCRLMNFCKQKYLDEILKYTADRFSQKSQDNLNDDTKCDVFLFGYSLGGNHILRY